MALAGDHPFNLLVPVTYFIGSLCLHKEDVLVDDKSQLNLTNYENKRLEMAMERAESVIDIEALVAPLSPENPCGYDSRTDTSFDSPYHMLKDARESAMALERPDKSAQPAELQRNAGTDVSRWRTVVDNAIDILQNKSKDLEVCALLIEGLARTDGTSGIRDGLQVATRLIDDYWDELFPRIDPTEEDSIEDRIAAFTGLNGIGQPGTLATYIAKFPVTNDGGMEHFRSYDYDRAWTINNNSDPESRDEQAAALGFTLDDIFKAAAQTPATFFIEMKTSLDECREELHKLDQAFMKAAGHDAPPSAKIDEALEKLSDVISHLGKDKLDQYADSLNADADNVTGEDTPDQQTPAGDRNKSAAPTGAISSREDAVSRLRTIAEYFRKAEPHSPLSYSLQNIIRWSELPLDRLIEEWIQDPEARSRYMLMTGMGSSGAENDSD
jgi:type VI secretion system protein ImpA